MFPGNPDLPLLNSLLLMKMYVGIHNLRPSFLVNKFVCIKDHLQKIQLLRALLKHGLVKI